MAFVALSAQAQIYGELGHTSTSYKETVLLSSMVTAKSSPTAIRGLIGHDSNENLALEGMFAFGLSGDDIKVGGFAVPSSRANIDNVFGIYLKPKTKLSQQMELYGRLGFVRAKGTASVGSTSTSGHDNSFSGGLGLSYLMNQKMSFNADYMQYLNKDGVKLNGFTVGVGFKF